MMASKVSNSPPSESRGQVNCKWIVRSLPKLSSTSASRQIDGDSLSPTRAYRSADVQSGISVRETVFRGYFVLVRINRERRELTCC